MALENPNRRMRSVGQTLWLCSLHGGSLSPNRLARLANEDAIAGVLFNSDEFEDAITSAAEYGDVIRRYCGECRTTTEIYQQVAVNDVRKAAAALLPQYEASDARDGYAGIPTLAELTYDTGAIIEQGRDLWDRIGHPNVIIQIPSTPESLKAITQLVIEGINVAVMYLVSVRSYQEVADAYMSGLEGRLSRGKALKSVNSVACVPLGMLVTECEGACRESPDKVPHDADSAERARRWTVAMAKKIYREYWRLIHGARFRTLARHGARSQRLLWVANGAAGSMNDDPEYQHDLTGPSTIRSVSVETLERLRSAEQPKARLQFGWQEAESTLDIGRRLCPDLQRSLDQTCENLITTQVMHTDAALNAIEARAGK